MRNVETADDFVSQGLYREAIYQYQEALKLQAHNATAHAHLGFILLKVGDYKGAIQHLEQSLNAFKTDFEVNFALAEAYRVSKVYSKSIYFYQSALEIRKNDLKALRSLAWTYLKIRFYSEALQTATAANSLYPKDEDTKVILARTLISLKQFSKASGLVRNFPWSSQNKAGAYSLGGDIAMGKGKINEAMKFYRKALKDNPLLASALFGLAKALMQKRDFAQARTFLEKGIRIAPEYVPAYLQLAQIYETVDLSQSVAFYQKFYEFAALDPEYIESLESIEKKIASLSR